MKRLLLNLLRVLPAPFFVFAGALHFTHTDIYRPMMPDYLPWHDALIYLSGAFEILGGLGLLIPSYRRLAGLGLIALLIAVFPANLYMAMHEVYPNGTPEVPALLWGRLPFQVVFIYWVWWACRPRG